MESRAFLSSTKRAEAFSNVAVLILSVNVGSGQKESITIHEHDTPNEVIRQFGAKHKLSRKVQDLLLQKVEFQLHDIVKEHLSSSALGPLQENANRPFKKSRILHLKTEEKPESEKPSFSVSVRSCGERLYFQGMLNGKEKERERAFMKSQMETEELSQFSFHPKINSQSAAIASKAFNSPTNGLLKEQRKYHKIEATLNEKFERERRNCTFQPKIAEYSRELLRQKHTATQDAFTGLYEESQLRKERLQASSQKFINSEFTFKPTVNTNKMPPAEEVSERLYRSREQTDRKVAAQKAKLACLVDPNTGKDYFKPAVGRGPHSTQSCLHKCRSQQELPHTQTDLQGRARSESILMKVKSARFAEIFSELGPNESGLILPGHLAVHSLGKEVSKSLAPLLEEIENITQPISYKDFVEALENLLKILTPEEKNTLLFKKRGGGPEGQLAGRSPAKANADVYGRHCSQLALRQEQLVRQRQDRDKEALDCCTFRPKTTPFNRDIFRY